MNKEKIDMLATIVREHREARGFTQKEVSENSGVSLRSIQRIENGEVSPRMYTVKVLSECLGFSLDFLQEPASTPQVLNTDRRFVLAIVLPLLVLLLAVAFLAQSARFPETAFEEILYWASVVLVIGLIQFKLWGSK